MSNRKHTTRDLIAWFDFMVSGQKPICKPGHLIAEALPAELGGSYPPSFLKAVLASGGLWDYAEQRGFIFKKSLYGSIEIWYLGTAKEREAIKEEHRRLTDKAVELAKQEHAPEDVMGALPFFAGVLTHWILTPTFRKFVKWHWKDGYDSKGFGMADEITRKAERLLNQSN